MRKRTIHQVVEEINTEIVPVSETSVCPVRCSWVKNESEAYKDYHDKEWGKVCHDERTLFEMLNLEGAQAGLSWQTVLNKRENYRIAFDNWDAEKISLYDQNKIDELLQNPGIIRHRLKVHAIVTNAKAYLKLCEEFGGLDTYLWSYVPDKVPILSNGQERITSSPLSEAISKDLKKRQFKFVGPTIIYAYLQAIGIVNDHDINCHWR